MVAQVISDDRTAISRSIGSRLGNRRNEKFVYYVLASEQFLVPDLVDYGVAAEKAGFDGVWTSDHFQPWQTNEGHSGSAFVILAALSQRTSRIKFGTGVTCPTFRYRPATVAQVWASMNLLSPGRVFLGIGTGENLNEGASGGDWASYEERTARLIESVNIIRSLWTGDHVSLKGRYWQVDARLYDPPNNRIPIYVAAGGPKSAHLAGLYGDGLVTGAATLRKNRQLKKEWERGVEESLRDTKNQDILVEHWAVIGEKEDEATRKAASKWQFSPNAWKSGYFDSMSPEDIQARAEKEVPLERVLDDWAVSKDPHVHSKAIQELYDLGATHVVVHVATENQNDAINFFGSKVIPDLHN